MLSLLEIVNIALANGGVSCFFSSFKWSCATHEGTTFGVDDLVLFDREFEKPRLL